MLNSVNAALFWISDMRTKELPEATQDYLSSHYTRGDRDLHVLGFDTEATTTEPRTTTIDVIRAGNYYLHRVNRPPRERPSRRTDILLDGEPVHTNQIFLKERKYALTVLPHSPRYVVTPVETSFFSLGKKIEAEAAGIELDEEKRPHYSMMFQMMFRSSESDDEEPDD